MSKSDELVSWFWIYFVLAIFVTSLVVTNQMLPNDFELRCNFFIGKFLSRKTVKIGHFVLNLVHDLSN